MARLARCEIIDSSEPTVVHVINRTVRRCFLLGDDPISGQNFDHRKQWIEDLLERFAGLFGIELLCYSILSNHYHLILRTRPEIVAQWDDYEVSRRWLLICPRRKINGQAAIPTQSEIDSIRNCPTKIAEIRKRLSDVSWWMRLLNQRVAQRANRDDEQCGRFWQDRFRAIRIDDEASLLACAAYVDLNPIRAGLAQTIDRSEFTSIRLRIDSDRQAKHQSDRIRQNGQPARYRRDAFLAKLTIDERKDEVGVAESVSGHRLSDKGFLPISNAAYVELLEWTAIHRTKQKSLGDSHRDLPDALSQIGISHEAWRSLVDHFNTIFGHVAASLARLETCRSLQTNRHFRIRPEARRILASAA
ncbi:hypothetical protein LOC67_08075 [Stieleria sp. JC731]|uniref:transposase n=1 Tax=Pirellulaceae TaxID=2691357 RepID=UPI001E3828CD|nr:transposase [Stieleria sp. JC731]MCC9600515.1 hypothetical protein [Stieleria sp. JC731]